MKAGRPPPCAEARSAPALGVRSRVIIADDHAIMRDGLRAIRELAARGAKAKVIVLTMHKTEEHIRAALEAGASAYLLKDCSRAELLTAMRMVTAGKTYITPAVAGRIVARAGAGRVRSLSDTLTVRERQVLKLIAEGCRNRDIAEALFLSVKTVEKHRANLMCKLDLHSIAALTSFAIENNLIDR